MKQGRKWVGQEIEKEKERKGKEKLDNGPGPGAGLQERPEGSVHHHARDGRVTARYGM